MRNRKLFAVMAAFFSLFMIVGIAAAQDQVVVSVTSEPIQENATCDKAGGFSLAFDTDTVLTVGDIITIDLDFGVVLCRDIDLEISDGGNAGPWTAPVVMANTIDDPIYYIDDTTGTAGDLVGAVGVYFRVAGNDGSQRITLSVLGPVGGTLTVGPDASDQLVLKFLDQDVSFGNPGIYTDDDGDGSYTDAAELEDNTLCIDVSDPTFTETKVEANMDSAEDKYTFNPSNPQVAHIVPQQSYQFAVCKNRECGDVLIGSRISLQAGNTEYCPGFDNEDHSAGVYVDYCTALDPHTSNNLIIQRTDDDFALDQYNIRLTILVNGETGDNGVYFTNEAVEVEGYPGNLIDTVCVADDGTAGTTLTTTFYNEFGNAIVPAANNDAECDVVTGDDAVSLLTSASNLGFTAGDNLAWIDMPMFHYDLDLISDGDVVSVRVEFLRAPCGELFSGEWCVATLVLSCPTVAVATTDTLVYPYFTNMTGDTWWDGMTVANLSSTAGTFTATFYEQDGDVATYTSGTVNGNSQWISILSTIATGLNMTVSTGSGAMGDSPCYVVVCSDFSPADGFAMIGSTQASDVDGSETMGYLPRIEYSLCSGM